MIVRRIWWQPFRVPHVAALLTAYATETAREGVIFGIETDDGRVGSGEASPLTSYGGGTALEAAAGIALAARESIRQPVGRLWDMTGGPAGGWQAAVRCGLETAAADLLAQAEGLPLYRWLASHPSEYPRPPFAGASITTVAVNATIDGVPSNEALEQARALVSRGFTTIKVKVGIDDQADEARVAAVRAGAGERATIRLDANGAWPAAEVAERLERFARVTEIALCEEPTMLAQLQRGWRWAVRERTKVRIAADESCRSSEQLFALMAADNVDIAVVKPMIAGLHEALRIAEDATVNAFPVIVTTSFDAGIGTAAAVHLAAALGPDAHACGLATLERLEDDLILGGLEVADGTIAVPQSPGLGVQLDEAALDRYATGPRQEVAA